MNEEPTGLPLQPLDKGFEIPLPPVRDWDLLEKLKKNPDVRFVPALIDDIYKLHETITSSNDELKIKLMQAKDFNEHCQHELIYTYMYLNIYHPELFDEKGELCLDKMARAVQERIKLDYVETFLRLHHPEFLSDDGEIVYGSVLSAIRNGD